MQCLCCSLALVQSLRNAIHHTKLNIGLNRFYLENFESFLGKFCANVIKCYSKCQRNGAVKVHELLLWQSSPTSNNVMTILLANNFAIAAPYKEEQQTPQKHYGCYGCVLCMIVRVWGDYVHVTAENRGPIEYGGA